MAAAAAAGTAGPSGGDSSHCLGRLLLDFLHFFGTVFDARRSYVSLRAGGAYPGRGGIEDQHSTDVESKSRVRASV